jgi:microcystin-dependent protein
MEPFVGEIRLFPFASTPRGWAACNGSLLVIQQYAALYALIGKTYGGDGKTNFALPDLRGRVPINMSPNYLAGVAGGTDGVTLTTDQMASHSHSVAAYSTPGVTGALASAFVAQSAKPAGAAQAPPNLFAAQANSTPIDSSSVAATGGPDSHENRQPFLAMNYCIALTGLFPARS